MTDLQTPKYQPVIERKEINDSHFYWVDGEFFPSVTKILNYAPVEFGLIEFWKNNSKEDSDKILEMAGNRGSAIHDACERLLRLEKLELTREFPRRDDQKILVAFTNFVARFHPEIKPDDIEKKVASAEFKYAGTLDISGLIAPEIIESYCRESKQVIFKTDNPRWIIDIKTSKSIHYTHFCQIKAYEQANFEMTGEHSNTAILHLSPTYKSGYKFITDMRPSGMKTPVTIQHFMNIYNVYLDKNDGQVELPPVETVYPTELSLIGSKYES